MWKIYDFPQKQADGQFLLIFFLMLCFIYV